MSGQQLSTLNLTVTFRTGPGGQKKGRQEAPEQGRSGSAIPVAVAILVAVLMGFVSPDRLHTLIGNIGQRSIDDDGFGCRSGYSDLDGHARARVVRHQNGGIAPVVVVGHLVTSQDLSVALHRLTLLNRASYRDRRVVA